MKWPEALTRELHFLELAIGALLLLVIFTAGFLVGASVYSQLVAEQGAALESVAARHCIWLDPPRRP